MATITEDYVSFETAKLLKEKGFNEPIQYFYKFDSKELYRGTVFTNTQIGDKIYNAPTLQMAMKWLRRVHNVCIDIVSVWNQKRFEYQVYVVTPENAKHCYVDNILYLGYEEAVESAIKYCLENLI